MLRAIAQVIERKQSLDVDVLEAALDALARASGDRRIRRVARMVNKPLGGRSPIDDHDALTELRWVLATGRAKSLRHVALMVARRVCGDAPPSRVAERLRRKLREQTKREATLSIPPAVVR